MPKAFNLVLSSLIIACLGFLGWRALEDLFPPEPSKPCIASELPLYHPLWVGQTTRLTVGKLYGNSSDCILESQADKAWVWSSDQPKVATVAADGTVTGIAPGKFGISVKTPIGKAYTSGTVWPVDALIRIQPTTATVRVGDRVSFQIVATTAQGKKLPLTSCSITTPDYQSPGMKQTQRLPQGPPLLDRNFYSGCDNPAIFKALRPGTVIVTGEIAAQKRAAKLTILPR